VVVVAFRRRRVLTVIVVSLHFAEAREFVRVVEGTKTSWLVLAVVLQAATYYKPGSSARQRQSDARLEP
jgi:hypothetical protein